MDFSNILSIIKPSLSLLPLCCPHSRPQDWDASYCFQVNCCTNNTLVQSAKSIAQVGILSHQHNLLLVVLTMEQGVFSSRRELKGSLFVLLAQPVFESYNVKLCY